MRRSHSKSRDRDREKEKEKEQEEASKQEPQHKATERATRGWIDLGSVDEIRTENVQNNRELVCSI